jgi:chromosome segregation ATPase
MDYKDTIIDELKKENHALMHGPHSYDGTLHNLHTAEDTLAITIDERNKAEATLRNIEDANSAHINAVDADRSHLKHTLNDKEGEAASLRATLNALRAAVGGKTADLDHLRHDYDVARSLNADLRNNIQGLNGDIVHEQNVNSSLIVELDKVNDGLHYNTNTVEFGLRNDNARSRDIQVSLDAQIAHTDKDIAHTDHLICERSDLRQSFLNGIDHKTGDIHALTSKIDSEAGHTYVLSKDNGSYAARNQDLDGTVARLRLRLDDGNMEIAALRASLADLSSANDYRYSSNFRLEKDIDHLTGHVDHLAYANRNIDRDVNVEANREAWLKGNYHKADYLHSKQRVYDKDLQRSANHVEYVRATSPARSPHRRFY